VYRSGRLRAGVQEWQAQSWCTGVAGSELVHRSGRLRAGVQEWQAQSWCTGVAGSEPVYRSGRLKAMTSTLPHTIQKVSLKPLTKEWMLCRNGLM